MPNFEYEQKLFEQGHSVICGVDEVGRGPLAGPVTAAAVILDVKNIPNGLNDSKKLSLKRRNELFLKIQETSKVACVHVWPDEIDEINILQASLRAMERAVLQLDLPPDHVLVDGNKIPHALIGRASAIVKGDSKSLSIAAASIIAKVIRDTLMAKLDVEFPGYGWAKNAGYPTKCHMNALVELGVTPYHRRSFKPVHNILYQDE